MLGRSRRCLCRELTTFAVNYHSASRSALAGTVATASS